MFRPCVAPSLYGERVSIDTGLCRCSSMAAAYHERRFRFRPLPACTGVHGRVATHFHGRLAERSAMTNRLANETSPYLLQHAHNPVDWYPWGEEAFSTARELDR